MLLAWSDFVFLLILLQPLEKGNMHIYHRPYVSPKKGIIYGVLLFKIQTRGGDGDAYKWTICSIESHVRRLAVGKPNYGTEPDQRKGKENANLPESMCNLNFETFDDVLLCAVCRDPSVLFRSDQRYPKALCLHLIIMNYGDRICMGLHLLSIEVSSIFVVAFTSSLIHVT